MAWVVERRDIGVRMATALLLLITLVAAFLRLYNLSTWQHFFGDEGREMFSTEEMLTHGTFPLLGPPLAGYNMSLGPIFYYIIAPAVWIAHYQPIGAAALVALFGVATVLLLFKFGLDFFESRLAGLIAATTFAASQVAVYHARYVWNPNLAPFFVAAVLYCLCAVIRGRQRFLPWLGLTLSIATQLQPVLIIALPAVAVIWLIYRPRIANLWLYPLAVALFVAAELPLVIYELRTNFANTRGWIDAVKGIGGSHLGAGAGATGGLRTRLLHDAERGGQLLWQFYERIMGLDHLRYALPLLAVCTGVLVWTAVRARRESAGVAATVIFLWTAAYFVGFGLYPKPVYEQYFVALFPLPFLMLGLAADRLWWSGWGILGRLAVLAVVFALAGVNINGLWQTQFELRPYQIDQAQYGGMQAAGMTIADVQQVVDYIAATTDHHSFNLVVAATDDHDTGYRYLLHLKGFTPARSLGLNHAALGKTLDPAIVYPGTARNFFIIIQPRWWPPSQWPSWIQNVSTNKNNIVHPDVEFRYALVRYVQQMWVPLDVSPKYNMLPCDEGQKPVPTSCSSIPPGGTAGG